MVDLILFCAVFGAFLGGFYCGKKFGSLTAMFTRMKAAVADWCR